MYRYVVMSIKPCPFCGSRKTTIESLGDEYRPFFVVSCRTCEAEGPIAQGEERAVECWNIRRRPKHDGH